MQTTKFLARFILQMNEDSHVFISNLKVITTTNSCSIVNSHNTLRQSPFPRLIVNSLKSKLLISFSCLNLQSDICDCGLPLVFSHSFLE